MIDKKCGFIDDSLVHLCEAKTWPQVIRKTRKFEDNYFLILT